MPAAQGPFPRPQQAWTTSAAESGPALYSPKPCTTTYSSNSAADIACKPGRPVPATSNGIGGSQYDNEVYVFELDDDAVQREFMGAASQLSESEIRDFVLEHIRTELRGIRALPAEQRSHAFRMLLVEWHPDKCPAIAGLATEVFQLLQEQ